MWPPTKTRQKEIFCGLIAAAVAVVLVVSRSVSIDSSALVAHLQTAIPGKDMTRPRARHILHVEKAGASPVSFIRKWRKQATQDRFNAIRKNAFQRANVGMLPVPKPNASFDGLRFNSLGMRGPELVNSDKRVDIVFLGSSKTLDRRTIPDSKSWPGMTTRLLNKRIEGCIIQYQNAGVPGLSSRALKLYYERRVLPGMSPDIVIIMTDDRARRLRELGKSAGVKQNEKARLTLTRAALMESYQRDLREIITSVRSSGAIPVVLGYGQRLQADQTPAERIAAKANIRKNHPAFVTLEDYLRSADWYNEQSRQISAAESVIYVPWQEQLNGLEGMYRDLLHFSAKGSVRLAQVIAATLAENPGLREALARSHGCASAYSQG